MHFAQLFFVETDELVIEVDGFERLDKERLAAAAGSVDDAFDAALAPGHNRNYKAIVADGDEILLQSAVFAMGAEEALQRFLNQVTLLLVFAAEAGESDAGMIGKRSVRQNFAAQVVNQLTQIGDLSCVGGEARESFGRREENAAGFGGQVQEAGELVDFSCVEGGAFDAELG